MNLKFIGVAAGIASLLGAFMPMAAAGNMYVSINHMGGISYLLYPLAIAALAIAVTSIYKPELPHLKTWSILLAVCGLILTALSYSAAKSHVAYVAQMSGSMRSMFDNMNAPVQQVNASIGSGAILQFLGYAGLLASIFLPVRTTAVTTALFLCLVSTSVAEEPRPFGLVLGKSTPQEVRAVIQKEGGKITVEGNRVIDKDINNPSVTGMEVAGLSVPDLRSAQFWFYKDVLMEVNYFFPASMDKSEFYRLTDQLKEKYGKTASYRRPQLSDGLALWKTRDTEVRLAVPWVASATTVAYRYPLLINKAKADDKQVYAQQTKQRAKSQKGL